MFKFNWVLFNELAISSAPSKEENLEYIYKEGIKSIFTLCSEEEINLPSDINKQYFHRRLILPDHSYKIKLKNDDIKKALEIMNELIGKGSVLVHCYAGVERSPLICIAWLMQSKGLDIDDSLRYLMEVNPGTNPLPQLLNLLRKFF